MFERMDESLDIELPVAALAPTVTLVSKNGKPNPLPNKKMLPGKKQGALTGEMEERDTRSNETADVKELT